MSITKFSPQDINRLAERFQKIEQGIKNLKMERKVYFSDAIRGTAWTDWTPTYGADSPMTYTSVTTSLAQYCVIDKMLFFIIWAMGTTGGSASKIIRFTVPVNIAYPDFNYMGGGCEVRDGTDMSGVWEGFGADQIIVKKYDDSNWGLGSGRRVIVQGFYRID